MLGSATLTTPAAPEEENQRFGNRAMCSCRAGRNTSTQPNAQHGVLDTDDEAAFGSECHAPRGSYAPRDADRRVTGNLRCLRRQVVRSKM